MTFKDIFPGLSRTKVIFQDFTGPGIFKKKSRTFQEASEPCIVCTHAVGTLHCMHDAGPALLGLGCAKPPSDMLLPTCYHTKSSRFYRDEIWCGNEWGVAWSNRLDVRRGPKNCRYAGSDPAPV